MATVVLTLESVCAGGGHANISVTVNGVARGTFAVLADDVLSPLADEDVPIVLAALLKLGMIGRTKAQMRGVLQAGYQVTTE
jgi:hypothetical protein